MKVGLIQTRTPASHAAALAHSAAEGWPAEAYQKLGAGWVVRSHQIEYLQPAFPGDQIVVQGNDEPVGDVLVVTEPVDRR